MKLKYQYTQYPRWLDNILTYKFDNIPVQFILNH